MISVLFKDIHYPLKTSLLYLTVYATIADWKKKSKVSEKSEIHYWAELSLTVIFLWIFPQTPSCENMYTDLFENSAPSVWNHCVLQTVSLDGGLSFLAWYNHWVITQCRGTRGSNIQTSAALYCYVSLYVERRFCLLEIFLGHYRQNDAVGLIVFICPVNQA